MLQRAIAINYVCFPKVSERRRRGVKSGGSGRRPGWVAYRSSAGVLPTLSGSQGRPRHQTIRAGHRSYRNPITHTAAIPRAPSPKARLAISAALKCIESIATRYPIRVQFWPASLLIGWSPFKTDGLGGGGGGAGRTIVARLHRSWRAVSNRERRRRRTLATNEANRSEKHNRIGRRSGL